MEKAIVIIDGEERLVGAGKIAHCHGFLLRGELTRAICPRCKQEVHFAAGPCMAPHFRHASNNPIAQRCELYAQGEGGGTPYERIPPPVFIRQKYGSPGTFVIEMGLKRIKDSVLSKLESEGAKLVIPDGGDGRERWYQVTRERFGVGMSRIPIGFSIGGSLSDVRLARASKSFKEVWGASQSTGQEAIFKCDRDSLSGRRIESWGSVSVGDSILIVSRANAEALRKHFPDVERVGSACAKAKLSVYLATVEDCSEDYLFGRSITLEQTGDVPQILWPPALTTDGATVPLFSKSNSYFRVRTTKDENGATRSRVFVHAWTDVRVSHTVPLEATYCRDWMVAAVQPVSSVRFLSTSDWSFSNTILLGFRERPLERLNDSDGHPEVTDCGNGDLMVATSRSCDIKAMRRDGRGETLRAFPGDTRKLRLAGLVVLRISAEPVVFSHGKIPLVEYAPESSRLSKQRGPERDVPRWPRDSLSISKDKLFVKSRKMSQRVITTRRDAEFALARKAAK